MIPDWTTLQADLLTRGKSLPEWLGVGLCLAGLLCMFAGTYARRGLSVANFGAVGAVLGLRLSPLIGAHAGLTAWTGAMTLMALSYPVHRAAQAATGFAATALGVMVIGGLLGVPKELSMILMAVLGLMVAGLTFAVRHKAMAAALALEGSLLFLAGSLTAPRALGLEDGFPLYNMIEGSSKTVVLLLCIVLPAAIGFSVQMAVHDPTIKESAGT